MDCTGPCERLLSFQNDVTSLPSEVIYTLQRGTNVQYLDALASLALDPRWTAIIFSTHEKIFVDICARWISDSRFPTQALPVAAALARILPEAPYLSLFAEDLILRRQEGLFRIPFLNSATGLNDLPDDSLQGLLLTFCRLLDFDNETYASAISPVQLQVLLRHPRLPVRYLAVRILCSYLHAADAAFQKMVQSYIGNIEISGEWEGQIIDYTFFCLWENKRESDLNKQLIACRNARPIDLGTQIPRRIIEPRDLSNAAVCVAGVLIPKIQSQKNERVNSSIILTENTTENLRLLAEAVNSLRPILIKGPLGVGKTSLIKDIAKQLDKDSSMLTLHLNEQTDAKLLIGMYTSTKTPGSFSWQPGVLTTAVKEGRWVMIEDLDRAPPEVISVLLPLLQQRELFVPHLNASVKAARGFKLIATLRTTPNFRKGNSFAGLQTLGSRHWAEITLRMPTDHEVGMIIVFKFPVLHDYLPSILRVYSCLKSSGSDNVADRALKSKQGRPTGLQDLMKWCRRLEVLLNEAGVVSGDEPISEGANDDIFLEAVDCFTRAQSETNRDEVVALVAQMLYLPLDRARFCVHTRIPQWNTTDTLLRVGRARLVRTKPSRGSKPSRNKIESRPFALTASALRLSESIARAIQMGEPCLLVGETGTGKTTAVQELARISGRKLVVANLSQQSEASDLLGGYKPANLRVLAMPMKETFDDLFERTFSSKRNQRFIETLDKAVAKSQWPRVLNFWQEALRMVESTFEVANRQDKNVAGEKNPKRRKIGNSKIQKLRIYWDTFATDLEVFQMHVENRAKGFGFAFVEGGIVKAARNGDWVLLDEINLASPDTLESLADLLISVDEGHPSLILSETGDIERVYAHKDFRIFGAMNPATDVGKHDLPISIRSRFTEYLFDTPDKDFEGLIQIVNAFLGDYVHMDVRVAADTAKLYLEIQRLVEENRVVDGIGQKPHFSLRTLTRTLTYATDIAPLYGLRRALFEGFLMSFSTLLNRESEAILLPLIRQHVLGTEKNRRALLNQTPRLPENSRRFVKFRHYWVAQGDFPIEQNAHYIITPFIERNLLSLVRATSTRRFPVLLQGPTSSGKTSMVEYLAKISGNKFVRINNHEHTDLQEYLGTYVSDANGQLRYQEGILIQALRNGHWIVLDELNLAPTDVLEALNRLLDDNRELLIPETQEVVRPHENFMLFATQNPPGLYAGRKTLSRAFRNRFLELHFDDIPEDELETILRERSQIAPSFCSRIVQVYKQLSILRQAGRLFEQKQSFATLRDLFRWAFRHAENREQLAANGFMLLGERVRKVPERLAVKQVIENVMKVQINDALLYSVEKANSSLSLESFRGDIVWTENMRRLLILVVEAFKNNEPVLLIGETGCGKTTICQVIADAMSTRLHIVNAHQNTETSDFIGAQRPVRNRAVIESRLASNLVTILSLKFEKEDLENMSVQGLLDAYKVLKPNEIREHPVDLRQRIDDDSARVKALFEWSDGSLAQAMRSGEHFLLDEISLADDSVLERLNSVLEPERMLLLAEKGHENSLVVAIEGFQFCATMNPGGDYGKKELSPALRNRFTEIWVPSISDAADLLEISQRKLAPSMARFARSIVEFSVWYKEKYSTIASSVSVREILTWINFVNTCRSPDPFFRLLHGAALVYIDKLGANPSAQAISPSQSVVCSRRDCLERLCELFEEDMSSIYNKNLDLKIDDQSLQFGPFDLKRVRRDPYSSRFSLEAPTTVANAMRVVRALQLQKPILLEGSPGVGKTALIVALANIIGIKLTRINLSEQTDVIDLFGSDVPVEGADAGLFAWRDAPFLRAMQRGEWVLLDEMNLASQSVLEGLNACLDHRGQVYIPELDQTFTRHSNFVVFATQNPYQQGGGRKGLPASFVNRFTLVYTDLLKPQDLLIICKHMYLEAADDTIKLMTKCVTALNMEIQRNAALAVFGGPWEFNLRDLLRWLYLLTSSKSIAHSWKLTDFLGLLFLQRFRTTEDVTAASATFEAVLGDQISAPHEYFHHVTHDSYQIGIGLLPRSTTSQPISQSGLRGSLVDPAVLESIMLCVQHDWPCLLVGASGSGKTSAVRHLASVVGADIVELPLNSDTDIADLVGGYEQSSIHRDIATMITRLRRVLQTKMIDLLSNGAPQEAILFLKDLNTSNPPELQRIHQLLSQLTEVYQEVEFARLKEECQSLIFQSGEKNKARFEWTNGLLVTALKRGSWLVLDNANLCSSSLLDRLNSLLESNGSLSVNEHRSADGSDEIVLPHPGFRLFLTMDPRYGELSRAMRNRCVELFFHSKRDSTALNRSSLGDACISRFQMFQTLDWSVCNSSSLRQLAFTCCDHLSFSDLSLFPRWYLQAVQGAMDIPLPNKELVLSTLKCFFSMIESNPNLFDAIKALYAVSTSTVFSFSGLNEVQTINPLNNPSILPMIARAYSQSAASQLASLLETAMEIELLEYQFHGACHASQLDLQPRSTTLERSIVSARASHYSKSIMQPLLDFFHAMFESSRQWLDWITPGLSMENIDAASFQTIAFYLRDLFELTQSTNVDELAFRAYVSLGKSLCGERCKVDESPDLFRELSTQLDRFKASWELSTGRGMEELWQCFKPLTARTTAQLENTLQIEQLADRFDALTWRSMLPPRELVELRSILINSLTMEGAVEKDTLEDIQAVEQSFQNAENSTGPLLEIDFPHFKKEFESLCQYFALEELAGLEHLKGSLDIFAGRQTKSNAMSCRGPNGWNLLSKLHQYTGIQDAGLELATVRNTFAVSIFQRIADLPGVPLRLLSLLNTEKGLLMSSLAHISGPLLLNQASQLSKLMAMLHLEILKPHEQIFDHQNLLARRLYLNKLARGPADESNKHSMPSMKIKPYIPDINAFRTILDSFIDPSLFQLGRAAQGQEDQIHYLASSIVLFFTGCLLHYVPDRPFDPALRPTIERNRYQKRNSQMQDKLQALTAFEDVFTGCTTSPRIRNAIKDLQDQGNEPALPEVLRPSSSEMMVLQNEFKNVLNSIAFRSPRQKNLDLLFKGDRNQHQELQSIRQNIKQSIFRFSSSFRAYEDMTMPVVGFLRGLDVGLALVLIGSQEQIAVNRMIELICEMTPFLGAKPNQLTNLGIRDHCHFIEQDARLPLQYLRRVSLVRCIEDRIDPQTIRNMFDVFQSFYNQWKTQLQEDQLRESSKSSLYRYRGDMAITDETQDEEFLEIFPDDDRKPKDVAGTSLIAGREPRVLASDLARCQQDILVQNQSPSTQILNLLKDATADLAALGMHGTETPSFSIPTGQLLPGVVIALDACCDSPQSSNSPKPLYNFYLDANLVECEKIVALLQKVQTRFGSIKEHWPEHATLEDVLRTSRELLAFGHNEPVAKILTKAEKLHGFIHEWEIVASREFSASSLFVELTDLLIWWRRLELSTWARLLDVEDQKCVNDANSWWFNAYEIIIAAPLSILESGGIVSGHTKELLETLAGFLATTILGQYRQRLRLIEQLNQYLALLKDEMPALGQIHTALSNFVGFYSRFEHDAIETLASGRKAIEREIKDIIQLASWKDTNINALRESAKRSHRKLFAVVRKYRALLAEPTNNIIRTGEPKELDVLEVAFARGETALTNSIVSPRAIQTCEENVKRWEMKSLRVTNPVRTATKMVQTSQIPRSKIDFSAYLSSFTADLKETIRSLQLQTPSRLTDENKDTAKHLKSRKRKAFADVLKELRQMGFRSNLNVDALSEQRSVASVLANTPSFDCHDEDYARLAEYYFHRVLDTMPAARESAGKHSEELTSGEVARSIGYLEGILSLILQQRRVLTLSMSTSRELGYLLELLRTLGSLDDYEVMKLDINIELFCRSVERTVKWLPAIIDSGCEIINAHSRMGNTDSSTITEQLTAWRDMFAIISTNLMGLPKLPRNLSTSLEQNICRDANSLIEKLAKDLDQWEEEFPAICFVLRQIKLWTNSSTVVSNDNTVTELQVDLTDLDSQVSKVLDSILIATQRIQVTYSSLPSSSETKAWFTQADKVLVKSFEALDAQKIKKLLDEMMSQLPLVGSDSSQSFKTISSMCAVAFPIIDQYRLIHQYTTRHYGSVHASLCKMAFALSKSFLQISKQGFCSPSENPGPEDRRSGKTEEGTGLGEGEGVEDISKDIKDDEDLAELAQEANREKDSAEIESQKDAVDMQDDEIEGENGDVSENNSDEDEDSRAKSETELDEEVGDVDDLDPSAIDEKFWDGDSSEAEKSKEESHQSGKNQQRQKQHPRDSIGDIPNEENADESEDTAQSRDDENEEVLRDEPQKTELHSQDESNLDLPEDIDLGKENNPSRDSESDDEDMDDLSDINQNEEGLNSPEKLDSENKEESEAHQGQESHSDAEESLALDIAKDEVDKLGDNAESLSDLESDSQSHTEQRQSHTQQDRAMTEPEIPAPSDVQGSGGEDGEQQRENEIQNSEAQENEGSKPAAFEDNTNRATTEHGEKSDIRDRSEVAQVRQDDSRDGGETQAFKKLGDALEKWHRQRQNIRDAPQNETENSDTTHHDTKAQEFEHLANDDAEADTQALGGANEEQTRLLEENMLDSLTQDQFDDIPPGEFSGEEINDPDQFMEEIDDRTKAELSSLGEKLDPFSTRAFIRDHTPGPPNLDNDNAAGEEVEELDNNLSSINLEAKETLTLRSLEEARLLWARYEALARDYSLILTEQLRLILAPTLATKMRGDFRTGKRLNIKRIIPYIASQYKRDKIWMRRSIPSKRNYQIMLAVDDSKSMGEGGSGQLAFQTLALISKSLSMLEVGEICIVGFGEEVRVAHRFDQVFSSDAGSHVFQQFNFQQTKTNVKKLVAESIDLFAEARNRSYSRSSDIWQLELIISDGVCEDHEAIRRLVRKAQSERIMMVFVIVDALKGESIMDMSEATFEPDSSGETKLKIKRYLDDFPFSYYLIVGDVKDLPGVLATALRQWFAEVAELV